MKVVAVVVVLVVVVRACGSPRFHLSLPSVADLLFVLDGARAGHTGKKG